MDSFEFNKIAGAILGTALLVMALSIVSELIYEPHEPEKPGYEIAVAEAPATATGEAPAAVVPIAERLQSADPAKGQQVAARCQSCHSFGKGEKPKAGPNLWGVVGGPVGHEADFRYSPAMLDFKGTGATWTFENLDKFLTSPKSLVPKTAMTFAGLTNPEQRADVIDWLREQADSPVPLPAATAAAPEEKPAEGAPKPAEGAAPAEGAPKPAEGAAEGAKPQEGTAAPPEGAPKPEGAAPAEGTSPPAATPAPEPAQ